MIGALFDTTTKQVVDVFTVGDKALLMHDLVDLYNQVTGEKRTHFRNAREARDRTVTALTKKYFPTVENGKAMATPASQSVEAGPVARARAVFQELKGHPRKDVIAACVRLGVNRATAATQYQKWKKAQEGASAQAH